MIDITFLNGYDEVTAPHLTQWDYGQKLNIYGCNLVDGTQVHFYDKPCSEAIVKEGTLVTVDGVSHLQVDVPDVLLENTYDIRAYVYITTETSGQSTKTVLIPVTPRTKPEDYVSGDDPSVHSITEAVRIANEARTTANEADATANTANSNASAAVETANTANSNASAAVSTANTANSNANAAVVTANAADAKVDAQDADIATFKSTVNGQLAAQDTEIDTFEATINGQITELESEITQGLGTKVSVGGTLQNTWNADTKQDKGLTFTNTTIAIGGFVADTTYEDYPFKATIPLAGVTTAMIATVSFGLVDAISGIYAPICETYAGGVYLYASEANTVAVTIPTIQVDVMAGLPTYNGEVV